MPEYETYGNALNGYESATKNLRAGEDVDAPGKSAEVTDAGSTAESANRQEKSSGFYKGGKQNDSKESSSVAGRPGRSGIKNSVRGKVALENDERNKKKKGSFLKKKGPLLVVLALLGGLGGGIALSQIFMPFQVIESLTEMTDGSFTARSARMPSLIKWAFNMQAESGYTTEVRDLLGGKTVTRYRRNITSNRMVSRLASQGIDVDTSGESTILKYNGKTISADDYVETYRTDTDFRNSMNRGTRSFTGRLAAYIDLSMAKFLDSHSLTKNLFAGWINKVYDAEGQTTSFHDIITGRKPSAAGTAKATTGVIQDDGGEPDFEDEIKPKKNEEIDIHNSETAAGKYAQLFSSAARVTASAVCGAAAVYSIYVSAKIAIAYENARQYFSAAAEAVDKTKDGAHGDAPINETANDWATPDGSGTTALQAEMMKLALSGGSYTVNSSSENIQNFNISEMFKSVGTGVKWIIGCAAAQIATATVSFIVGLATLGTFSIGKALIELGTGVVLSTVAGVATEALVSSLIKYATTDFCIDVVGANRGACTYLGSSSYNGLNFQGGGGTPASQAKVEEFYNQYRLALADEAELIRSTKSPFDITTSHTFLGSIVSKLSMMTIEMPSLAGMLSGFANIASTSLNSLLPTASALDKTVYLANQTGNCEDLEYIGAVGDKNCQPIYVTDMSMKDSDPEETFVFLANYLEGDVECKYDGQDVSDYYYYQFLTKEGSPRFTCVKVGTGENGEDIFDVVEEGEKLLELDAHGSEQVEPRSSLAKFISYCANRTSPFGQVDQNIMNSEVKFAKVQTSDDPTSLFSRLAQFVNNVISSIPFFGDVVDAVQGAEQIRSLGWSTGANCVARGDNATEIAAIEVDGIVGAAIELKSWNDFLKYAQSYVSDSRLLENSDSDYSSAVIAYLDKQEEENPTDDSFEGWLARQTGYTKEQVSVALNDALYWDYVANYDPTELGPVWKEVEEPVYDFTAPDEIQEDYSERIAKLGAKVIYAPLRDRNFAA